MGNVVSVATTGTLLTQVDYSRRRRNTTITNLDATNAIFVREGGAPGAAGTTGHRVGPRETVTFVASLGDEPWKGHIGIAETAAVNAEVSEGYGS